MPEDPDIALLEAVASGDEGALRALMKAHKEKVFRFVYRWVGNEEDAAEITAETFVRVHRNASSYTPRAKVVTWIFSIAANLCRDFHRKAKRRRFLSLFSSAYVDSEETGPSWEDRIPDDRPTASESLEGAEARAGLLALIAELPPKLKTPFILHVLEEHSQRECAEILNVSEKTVETRIYRARKRIQEAMTRAQT